MDINRSEDLSKLVNVCFNALNSSPSWQEFIRNARGRSCLSSNLETLPHPAAVELLVQLRDDGAPVEFSTTEWTPSHIAQAMHRGSHPSAAHYLGFVEEEMHWLPGSAWAYELGFPGLDLPEIGSALASL